MEISNKYVWLADNKRNNNPLLPSNIRGLIIGKSNSGKTVVLLNLLLETNWLDYDHLYVFGKSLHQREYTIIRKAFERGLSKQEISNLFNNQDIIKQKNINPIDLINRCDINEKTIDATFFEDGDEIPDPKELDGKNNNLMVFDDCILEKQNKTAAYYTRGRHNNIDCFYISQNYFLLPRKTIRENTNFLILFPQDSKNITHIYQDHCTDIEFSEFKSFCKTCWETKHNFVVIDLTSQKLEGKYRCNFDVFYIPET